MSVLDKLWEYFVSGALAKGWGGPQCAKAVPLRLHVLESICWLTCAAIVWHYNFMLSKLRDLVNRINSSLSQSHKRNQGTAARTFELILSFVHVMMFIQIIYYKVNIKALVNLIQPCHVILLLQGIALYSQGITGVLITIFMLPALTGTLLAMLFPDTGGLDQPFEMDSYWLQHYLIQVVPLYLLARRNFQAMLFVNKFSIFMGIWILVVLHFSIFEIVDVCLMVNVEFMLCPTNAMNTIFSMLPGWITWPTYRSTICIGVIIVGAAVSYLYVATTKLLQGLFEVRSENKNK